MLHKSTKDKQQVNELSFEMISLSLPRPHPRQEPHEIIFVLIILTIGLAIALIFGLIFKPREFGALCDVLSSQSNSTNDTANGCDLAVVSSTSIATVATTTNENNIKMKYVSDALWTQPPATPEIDRIDKIPPTCVGLDIFDLTFNEYGVSRGMSTFLFFCFDTEYVFDGNELYSNSNKVFDIINDKFNDTNTVLHMIPKQVQRVAGLGKYLVKLDESVSPSFGLGLDISGINTRKLLAYADEYGSNNWYNELILISFVGDIISGAAYYYKIANCCNSVGDISLDYCSYANMDSSDACSLQYCASKWFYSLLTDSIDEIW